MSLVVKYRRLKEFMLKLIAIWRMPYDVERTVSDERYIEEHLTTNLEQNYIVITRVSFTSRHYFPWLGNTTHGYKVEIIRKINPEVNISHVEYFPEVLPSWLISSTDIFTGHKHIAMLIKHRLDSYR